MKNDSMGIAVIDDGINDGMFNINNVLDDVEITPELIVRQRFNDDHFILSHGTYCAAVIRKYLPKVPLYSIKIINNDGRGKAKQLVKALEWCIENNIKLINLSLGTVIYSDFEYISSAINCAVDRGIIIVAACNNMDIFTCPASLPNVIGVKCDKSGKLKEEQYIYHLIPLHGIDITAFSEHILLNCKGETQKAPLSNSLAAPYITTEVYNIIQEDKCINIKGIKEILYHHAVIQEELLEEKFLYTNSWDINIPIIGIYSENKKLAIELADNLLEYFVKDGYKIIITSFMEVGNKNYSKIIPINYYVKNITDPVNLDSLAILNIIYKPDLIMVVLDYDSFGRNLEFIDVCIVIDDGIKLFMNQIPYTEYESNESLKKVFYIKSVKKNINMKKYIEINDLYKIYYYILDMFNRE